MCIVYCGSYKQIQFCALFDKKFGKAGCPVIRIQLCEEFFIEFISDIFFQ